MLLKAVAITAKRIITPTDQTTLKKKALFQTRFLELIPRPIAGLKFSTQKACSGEQKIHGRWQIQGPGGHISGTRKHDQGSKRFQEPDNSRERRYRFPEPHVMFGNKGLHRNQHFYPSQLVSEVV